MTQAKTLSGEVRGREKNGALLFAGIPYAAPPIGERLARQIPNAKFFCAPATGHWAQFENYEIHNREVLRFLTGEKSS